MANAVHYHARITTQQSETGAAGVFATKQTITAANLSGAGFVNSDEALVLWWYKVAAGVAAAYSVLTDLKYNGTSVLASVVPTHRLTSTGRERAHLVMAHVSLGTLADFEVQLATGSGSGQAALMEKSELLIVRLADFGTENTDWFWNKSTSVVANTASYSGTSRATVTWTPGAVEDWVTIGYCHTAINNTTDNAEGRVTLDTALHSGDWSIEGEASAEEWPLSWFGLITSLSVASHTLTVETRDDNIVTANDHRESALLVFRKAKWTDIYSSFPGTVAVANASDVQVATITDTLTVAQPIAILGQGNMNLDTVDTQAYLWARQDGSIIDPQGDTTSALANGYAFDATDEVPCSVLAYISSESGAQDIDLFASQSDTASRNLLATGLLVWGMSLAAGAAPQLILPDADTTTTGWSTAPLWSKVDDGATPDGTVISAVAS